jgi:glycosyltransferase involved in cell wall biosynthesis
LPAALRAKTRVIYQSAPKLKAAARSSRTFTAIMVGHLRDEKDPLTFMRATGEPLAQGVRFVQIGDALDAELGNAARLRAQSTPNYRWLGGLPRTETRQRIKRAHVLVNCSHMEGGAQVILEAVQSATPVLASRVGGNVGMLGADYAGYFKAGDHAALAMLLQRCRAEPGFLANLQHQCALRALLFAPHAEKRQVLNLTLSALNAGPTGIFHT